MEGDIERRFTETVEGREEIEETMQMKKKLIPKQKALKMETNHSFVVGLTENSTYTFVWPPSHSINILSYKPS